MKAPTILVTGMLLVACATHSGVLPAGGDTLQIINEAATGFAGIADLKAQTLRQAGEHCAAAGQTFEVLEERETKPPFIFGNYPRVELRFRCAAK